MTDSAQARFRLPHWGWFLLATAVLVVGFVGLSIWLPYRREQQVILKIEKLGGTVEIKDGGPEWLRQLLGDRLMAVFDRVDRVNLVDASCRGVGGCVDGSKATEMCARGPDYSSRRVCRNEFRCIGRCSGDKSGMQECRKTGEQE